MCAKLSHSSLRLQTLPWGGWAAGRCSLLCFSPSFSIQSLCDSTAAVWANVSQRPDVIFYPSGKRVWNPAIWDRRHFMCSWQGIKGHCLSPAPRSWCLFQCSWCVQPAVTIAPANDCLCRGTSPACYGFTDRHGTALRDWPKLCQLLRFTVEAGAGPCTISKHLRNLIKSWSASVGLHIAALARRGFHLLFLLLKCFLLVPCMLVLCSI